MSAGIFKYDLLLLKRMTSKNASNLNRGIKENPHGCEVLPNECTIRLAVEGVGWVGPSDLSVEIFDREPRGVYSGNKWLTHVFSLQN